MSRLVVQKSVLNSFNFFNAETIEKSKKGEMRGGAYIHREEIAEKVSTDKKGNKRVTRYRYYYVDDMFKDSADTILDKIMSFFYKKFPDKKKKIEDSYKNEHIEKDYGVDKKTYFQHVMEYLSHKTFWDNKFSNPKIREKYKKPVNEKIDEKIDDTELEAPVDEVPEIKEKTEPKEPKEKKWKPNNSLMRKIWSLNTGRIIEKEEKQKELADKKLQQIEEKQPNQEIIKEADEGVRATINVNIMIENTYKRFNASNNDDKIKCLKKLKAQLKSNQKKNIERIEKLRNYNAWNDSGVGYFEGEIINKPDVDNMIRKYDENGGKDNFGDVEINYIDTEIERLKNEPKESEAEKHENRSKGMLGNQNAKKDGIIIDEVENGENKTNVEQGGISGGNQNLRNTSSSDSDENVLGSEVGSNDSELLQRTGELGVGPQNAEEFDFSTIGDGDGRVNAKKAKQIREACRKLLAEKTDAEMTNEDKALLAQYVGAGGSGEKGASNTAVLTEFYTPRKVINKCWELMDKWLPNRKTCIEPSSGIGRFAEGRNEKFTMFEYEPESARIAKILHPNAEVVEGAFEANWVRGGRFHDKNFEKFDCSVGNPPYMDFTGWYKGHYKEGQEFTRAEQYFLNRTLDSLKDNGVLVFVMPSGFLKGNSPAEKKAKEIIASKGKLLEAWRLPSDTFDTTSVGTDIIVVRKEKGDINDFTSDNYFKNNPSHVLGDIVKEPRQYGMIDVVRPRNGETFETEIEKINLNDIEAIVKELPKAETVIKETPEQEHNNRSNAMKGNKNAAGKHNFIDSTGKNMTAEEFNHKYGMDVNKKDLEIWKFTDYNGNIDTSKLTDEQLNYINTDKNYIKDGNNIVNVVNYASGNIREKLSELEVEFKGEEITKEDYEYKKSILEAAMPEEKKIGQFTLSPISDWTRKYVTKDGMSIIQGFYEWLFNGNVNLDETVLPIDSPVAPEEIAPEISLKDIIDYIERKEVRVGTKEADTKVDRAKLHYRKAEKRRENAEELFNKYLKEGLSKEDQEQLVKDWNNNFNAYKNPDYAKMPIFIDGMNENMGTTPFTLTPQQLKGISFLTNKGSGLLAYDVGVGKTVTGLCATVNQIQTGRAKRPLICVPNAVYENWLSEIHQHFPNLKVNELKNFSKDFISKDFKPEEGSLSVCTYEALEKITFKDETMAEISTDVEYATMHKTEKNKTDRQLAKEGEKAKELAGRMTQSDDDYVYLEDLGFDHITIDEVHNFKNIFYAPRNVNITREDENTNNNTANEFQSLGGSRSDRGEKLFAVTQYIQRHNNNRNVFGLSATPFQNSPIEIYNILSLFARQRLKDLGIYSLEEFVKQFAKLKSEYAVTATSVKEKMVMKSFNNLTALQNLITEYIDKVDGGEAHVIRPQKQVHTPKLEMTDLQKQIMDAEADYLEEQSKLPKEERDLGATLGSLNAMRMATLSPALVGEYRYEIYQRLGYDIKKPSSKEIVETSPKLKFVCDSVIAQYKNASNQGQVIYMPRGVEEYKYVTDYLVSHGVPRDAITEMAGGGSEKEMIQREAKTKEFNDVNGKCKIIIGSEAIKEGVNLNGNSTVLYNTMLGWNPTETQQVEGRIWRQGNKQGITHIVYPLLNDSIDPMMYQKYDEKKSRIDDLFSFKGDTLNVEEINPEELKFDLIKDPRKRADLEVRQFKDKAESNEKLYAKMIDVLARQAYVAFTDLNDNKAFAEITKKIKDEQQKYDVFKVRYDMWIDKRKEAEKSGNTTALDFIDKQIESVNRFLVPQKAVIDSLKKEPKRMQNAQKSMIENLAKRGIKSRDDAEKKRQEYTKLMLQARSDSAKADELKEQYYLDAVKKLAERQADIPSLDESIKMNIDDIRNNLHPMDEEWKAKIEAELKKALPMFFFMSGRFMVRK